MNLILAVQVSELELRKLVEGVTSEEEESLLELVIENLYKGKYLHLVYLMIKGGSFEYGQRDDLWFETINTPIFTLTNQNHEFLPYDDCYTDVPDPVERVVNINYPYISEFDYILRGFDRVEKMRSYNDCLGRDLSLELHQLLYKVFSVFELEYLCSLRELGQGLLYIRNKVETLDMLSI